MGLSIAISGGITLMITMIVLATVVIMANQIFTIAVINSEINNVNDSISKTELGISSIDACSGNDIVNFTLTNNGIEKLSNYDDFNFIVTYDANIGGIKTRTTEILTYNATAFSLSTGQAPIEKEIPHAYDEMVSEQNINTNAYLDLPGANLINTNFDINKKYLIYVTGQIRMTDASQHAGIRTVHGVTPFTNSEFIVEPRDGNEYHTYSWFTVWNPTTVAQANEDIKLQFKRHTNTGGDVVRVDQVTMFALEISERLTEDIDWFFDDDVSTTALTGAWSALNNAAITFTPDCPNDTWLVMTTAQLDPASNGNRYETRLQATGGVTTDVDNVSKEGEDNGNGDLYIETIAYTYEIPSVASTFTSQSQSEGGATGTREYSAVFALNLDKFKNHNSISTPILKDIGTTPDWVTEIQTLSFTPEEAGDVWVLGYFIHDQIGGGGSGIGIHSRMQVYETGQTQVDQPPTQTVDLLQQNRMWDFRGQHEWTIQTVEHFEPKSYTADIDADVVGGSTIIDAIYRTLAFVSMIKEDCIGGDPGSLLEVNEWTFNCILDDNLDQGIINTNDAAVVSFKLQYPIFADGFLEISISTDNGITNTKLLVVP